MKKAICLNCKKEFTRYKKDQEYCYNCYYKKYGEYKKYIHDKKFKIKKEKKELIQDEWKRELLKKYGLKIVPDISESKSGHYCPYCKYELEPPYDVCHYCGWDDYKE